VGQHQREGFVQALRERLDVEFRMQLLAHLGDGVVPALAGRAVARRKRRRGGGQVAEELGDEGGEGLAGSRGVWYSCHNNLSLVEGLRGACGATVPE